TIAKPMDIDYATFRDDASVGELTGAAFRAILNGIATQLGSTTSGLVTREDKVLYETAIKSGEIQRDSIEKLAMFLPKIAKAFTETDLTDLLPSTEPETVKSLERAIAKNLEQSNRGFYLLIDDTDQLAAPDRAGHLNRIWA